MTSEIIFIAGLLGALVLTAALMVYRSYAEREFYRLRCLDHWSQRFTESALIVLDNPETPRLTINLVEFLNTRIGDSAAVPPLWAALRSHQRGNRDLPSEILDCDRALRGQIADAISAGMLAVSYSEWFWGVRARAVLAGLIIEAAGNPKPIMDVVKRMPSLNGRWRRQEIFEAA